MSRVKTVLPIALVLLGLQVAPARGEVTSVAARSEALDRALLEDRVVEAWALAESLVDAPRPWADRGLEALRQLGEDLSRCSDSGDLPPLTRLMDREDADGWLRWTAFDLLRTNLERCRSWEGVTALDRRIRTLDHWRVRSAATTSGVEDAFFHLRAWTPPPDAATTPRLRWGQRTAGRLFAATELCLERPAILAIRLDVRASGTLRIDGELVLMIEPGAPGLGRHAPAIGDVPLGAGCHEVLLGLATPPGWGEARVRLLSAEGSSGFDPRRGGPLIVAHGLLLRGGFMAAAELLMDIEDQASTLLARFRLATSLGQRSPLDALVAQATRPGRPGPAPCLLWRHRLDDVLLSGETEARPWLELWPEACQETLPGQLLEARHMADAGRGREAAALAAEVEGTLKDAGLVSCLALTTRQAQRSFTGENTPLLLDTVPFCSQSAYADAASRGDPEAARRGLALQARLQPPGQGFSGALQLARRLDAAGDRVDALGLLDSLSWQDPDLTWARWDLAGVQGEEELTKAADAPLASTDLRAREGVLSSWTPLDTLATSVPSTLKEYEESGWGEGPMVMVLDESILRLRAHGRVTERTTRIYHLRTQQAAQDWTDFQIPDSGQLLGLRVLKEDGTWREPDAMGAGDLANLGELAAGDLVIMVHVDEVEPPYAMADELCLPVYYFASRDVPVWRSRLVVRNESGQSLDAARFWGAPQGEALDHQTLVFETGRIDATAQEEALQRWDAGLPRVEICTPGMTWPTLRDQLADGLMAQITPDPALRALARDLATKDDPLRAAFEEVVDTVSADNSGLFSQRAVDVLADREGSSALLLLALLVEMDIPVSLALVDPPGGRTRQALRGDPQVHVEPLLRIPRDGSFLWLDPFGAGARFGAVRPFLGGREALLLAPDAPNLWSAVPREDPADHATRVRWEVRLDRNGGGEADLDISFRGIAGSSLWSRFKDAAEDRRSEAVGAFAQGYFPAAIPGAHSMEYHGGILRFRVSVDFPPGTFDEPTLLRLGRGNLQRRYAARSSRELPLLLDGDGMTTSEVRLIPPRGRRLSVEGRRGSLMTDFGFHETRWRSGKVLEILHSSHLADLLLPASRYDELVEFCRGADALDRVVLVLEPVR